MNRRNFLCLGCSTTVSLLAGCSSESPETPTQASTKTPTPTPTETPQPPKITSVIASELMDPRKLNPIVFQIHYANFDSGADYAIRAKVETDAGANKKTIRVLKEHGFYPGITGMKISLPEGTSTDGAIVDYKVSLLTDGTMIDTHSGLLTVEG